MQNCQRIVIACLAAMVLSGCATRKYRPAPISGEASASGFEARRLDDPGLRQFMEANARQKPSSWPQKTWDLETLTLTAFYFHPDLEVARARVAASEAAVVTAGARPNPAIRVAPGTTNSPESPWLFGFSFDLLIETAGKRGYRMKRAASLSEAARLDLGNEAWKVRSRLRSKFADHLIATFERDLVRRQEKILTERVSLLRARLQVGEIPRPEVDAAQIELSNTRLALRAAEGRVNETRASLAATVGVAVAALDGVDLVWPDFEQPPSLQSLSAEKIQREAVLNRLDVQRALAEYAAADTGVRLEIARQYPDITLGPGYDFDEGHSKFSVGVGVTLPVFNRNQGPIAEAEAHRKEAGASFLATQAHVIAESERALAQYQAAERQLAEADQTLMTLQAAQERLAGRALALGEADRLAWNGVLLQSAAAATARLEALRRAQTGLGALEDALQRPLAPAAPVPQVTSSEAQKAAGKELRK